MRQLRHTLALRQLPFSRLRVPALLGVLVMGLSGCSVRDAFSFGWPHPVTPQGRAMNNLWVWSWIAALVVGVIVWAAMFWTMYFDRKSRLKEGAPEFPRQTGYNATLEIICLIIPTVIVVALFYGTVITENYVMDKKSDPGVVVDVTAFRWNWKFGYREVQNVAGLPKYDGALPNTPGAPGIRKGEDGEELPLAVNGRSADDISYLRFDKIQTVGTDEEIPVLVLPTDTRIEFEIASRDVVHSFWVIDFLFKRDVFPNPKQNQTDNTFQISKIEREGAFVGRCAELCGTYHSMMNFEVRAVTPAKFVEYLKAREAGKTNAVALAAIGEAPLAIKTKPDPVKVAIHPNKTAQ